MLPGHTPPRGLQCRACTAWQLQLARRAPRRWQRRCRPASLPTCSPASPPTAVGRMYTKAGAAIDKGTALAADLKIKPSYDETARVGARRAAPQLPCQRRQLVPSSKCQGLPPLCKASPAGRDSSAVQPMPWPTTRRSSCSWAPLPGPWPCSAPHACLGSAALRPRTFTPHALASNPPVPPAPPRRSCWAAPRCGSAATSSWAATSPPSSSCPRRAPRAASRTPSAP